MEMSLCDPPLPSSCAFHPKSPSPAQSSAHTKHLESSVGMLNPCCLPPGWGLTETGSPVLIFKEERGNSLQARKLGIWEGFQPGDFQQDLKSSAHPHCNLGEGGDLFSSVPSPLLPLEDPEGEDTEPTGRA